MKAIMIIAFNVTVCLGLAGCGGADDKPNDLVNTSFFVTGANNTGEEDVDPTLLNGRHAVDLGTLEVVQSAPIDYDTRTLQLLYAAIDEDTGIRCIASLILLSNDQGPNPNYIALIDNSLAQDDSVFTIAIVDIPGPSDVVGIEFSYGFTINDTSYTSIMHAHYLNAADVTFDNPALTFIECASPTSNYAQTEPQIRAVLDSVTYLRGNVGEAG